MCYTRGKKIRFYKNYYKSIHKGNRVKYGYDNAYGIRHFIPFNEEFGDTYYHLRRIAYWHDYDLNRTVLWNTDFTVKDQMTKLRDFNGFPFVDKSHAYSLHGGTYRGFCRFLKKYSKIFPNGTIFQLVHNKYDMYMESMIKNDITMDQTYEFVRNDMEDWAKIRDVEIISIWE